MHNDILKEITEKLDAALKSAYPEAELSQNEIYDSIGAPPNLKMGHFAFPCFPLAKALRMGPPQIAAKIAESFVAEGIVKEAKGVGPYLNVFLNLEKVNDLLISQIIDGSFFSKDLTDNKPKTMIEYSQPNTHKEMHVGHMRNLCLGNSLVRIKKYCNQDIIPVTYPGDSGTHVAKCLWYLNNHGGIESAPKENKGAWLGSLYTTANLKLEDELGTEKEEQNRAELTAILKELESGSGETYDLWQKTRQWSIDLMNEVYDWMDVKFDRWFFESEVDSPSVELANKLYEDGLLVKDEGAIGMDLKDDKLGFCILIKSDGNGLYATKDVLLAKKKFEEFGVKENIYIVDVRQSFHFQQVFKVLDKMGFEQAKDCNHLQYNFVELPDGAMSSRKGNIVPLLDLIKNMQETIKKDYLEKYSGDWSEEEINETAKKIAKGAIVYGMVRVDNNRKIVFDMKEWLKLDGETGPYMQYVYARINSLCKKMDYKKGLEVDFNLLEKEQELALILKLNQFNSVVLSAHEQNKTMNLTSYLYELGKCFNAFYAECPIGKAETEVLKNTRLVLAKSTSEVMKKGLSLLGVDAPERM